MRCYRASIDCVFNVAVVLLMFHWNHAYYAKFCGYCDKKLLNDLRDD